MKTAARGLLVAVVAIWLAGCSQSPNIHDQVQEAIATHLTERPGIDASRMTIEVETVSVQGDKAEAEVVFRSRDTPDSRMNYHYVLNRVDGKWKVDSGRPSAVQSPHPGPGEAGGGSGALPEGHPAIGGGGGNPHGE